MSKFCFFNSCQCVFSGLSWRQLLTPAQHALVSNGNRASAPKVLRANIEEDKRGRREGGGLGNLFVNPSNYNSIPFS